jgi:hypothetical protein
MDAIDRAAEQSVGRAVAFAALGIGCSMLGLAGYPVMALRCGAVLTALMATILLIKAMAAPRRPHRRTEVWLLLDRPPDLPPERAQQLIGEALRRVFERYARWSATTALGFWAASLLLRGLDVVRLS